MRRASVWVLVLAIAVVLSVGFGPARAAQESGCAGSWLIHIALDGRDIVEDALVEFDVGGSVVVQSPPVLPALPGTGEVALWASNGLGTWEATGAQACAFTFTRLLAADDGVSVGALAVRGTAEADTSGGEISGTLDVTRSTGFGQTAATATGAFIGTPLGGPLR